jgi:DNA-directed RNA polymerase II subunit RPB1
MGSKEMSKKVASHIKFTTLGHIKDKITVYYDPEAQKKGGFMEQDNATNIYYTHNPNKNSCQAEINNLPWLMRIELNREKMLDKEVTLLDIKSKFCNSWEKRYADKNIKKEEKYVLDRISQLSLSSNTDNDKTPTLHIRFEMTDYSIALVNAFIDQIIDKFKLKGIPSINAISAIDHEPTLVTDGPDHLLEKKNHYVIYTQGVNLYDIRYINGIDIYKTMSNDVIAMYDTFGIEAARSTLAREIYFAYDRAGASVNYHHISLLVDLMTRDGHLTSIDRHGMNKSDVDPLSRASFEKTVEQLITAGFFGEVDHMKGVSSRIMSGLVIKGGTGLCDVILDTDMLEKSEYTYDIGQKYQKTYIPVNKSSINEHIANEEITGIFMPS